MQECCSYVRLESEAYKNLKTGYDIPVEKLKETGKSEDRDIVLKG